MSDIQITAYTASCAVGVGLDALRHSLRNSVSGLSVNDFPYSDIDTWIGRVSAADNFSWTPSLRQWQSRNNALAVIGLQQDGFDIAVAEAKQRYGSDRVAVIVGTSTSSIGRTETGYYEMGPANSLAPEFQQPQVHNAHSPALFVAHFTGATGPAMTISTACSSSAKVFGSAARWLAANLVDAVLVGGVDSLCLSVLHGFNSLELISPSPCRPFDQHRDGINIGEAAGFALLERSKEETKDGVRLSGYGESSDAYHMSHPHPEGAGAEQSMRAALSMAKLYPQDIGYINLHGTASRANDTIEAQALARVFTHETKASSTKGWTGHTLGAAGMLEALISVETLKSQYAPGTLNLQQPEDDLAFPVLQENVKTLTRHVMSNSFGFGGNNCSLVFSSV